MHRRSAALLVWIAVALGGCVVPRPAPGSELDLEREREASDWRRAKRPEPTAPSFLPPVEPNPLHLRAPPTTAEQQKALDRHRAQPIDAAFVKRVEATIRADLEKLAPISGFKVVSVECRTSTCLATVEWPAYEEAVATSGSIARYPYAAGCDKQLLPPDPPKTGGPYRAMALFDCAAVKPQ